jgi:Arc/MetJ family transcription regulator
MKTTLDLDESLLRQAREATGIEEQAALIHEGLRALIRRGAAKRLTEVGGTMLHFQAEKRRRSDPA